MGVFVTLHRLFSESVAWQIILFNVFQEMFCTKCSGVEKQQNTELNAKR